MDWGGAGGMERLKNHFDNYNGRYLGNLAIIMITRNIVIRTLFYAFINTGIIYLINQLLETKKKSSIALTLFLLLCMPALVYGQSFGWYSGFVNYNLGMFFVLWGLFLLLKKDSPFILFFVMIAGQLFMENITIFNVISAVIFLVTLHRTVKLTSLTSYFLGTLVGTAIMFSNSVYHQISAGNDGYRAIDFSAINLVLIKQYIPYMVIDNWLLITILSALIVYVIHGVRRFQWMSLYVISYTLGLVLFNMYHWKLEGVPFIFTVAIIILTIGYLLIIATVIFQHYIFKENRWLLLYLGIGSGVIISPFLVIEPFGPRGEFTSYLLLTIIVVAIWDKACDLSISKELQKYVVYLSCLICMIFIGIHATNRYVMITRMDKMEYSDDRKSVVISDVPFPRHGQNLSPFMSWVISPKMFREYYNLPDDLDIKFVTYRSQYLKDKEKELEEREQNNN
ncbi:hypothetical protein [Vagococcus xieshaowenii]|uniref:Uncharacterized protein n=1 Tax=Vagococcus xieshaowenii TaxID=2562451 RepID=A0AAJ5EEJ2_9ENTE|nr:hypothetical protein [Vagococcus xieshaowenii]QCA29264.1 hypothetical protein E4Z98_08010 [Vagococcus xieshaowenii]TFZ39844.1 hypothetical protein E4031_08415 [Vagococcus xieshaowenii]